MQDTVCVAQISCTRNRCTMTLSYGTMTVLALSGTTDQASLLPPIDKSSETTLEWIEEDVITYEGFCHGFDFLF